MKAVSRDMNAITYRSTQAGRWDFFYRAERNKASGVHPHDTEAKEALLEFPMGTSLEEGINHMLKMRLMPRGSARAGCFEVQTPDGIFTHKNENRIDLTTERRAANVEFTPFD